MTSPLCPSVGQTIRGREAQTDQPNSKGFPMSTFSKPSTMRSDDLDSPGYAQPGGLQDTDQQADPPVVEGVDQQLKQLARQIRAAHRRLEKTNRQAVAAVIELGQHLVTARDLLVAVRGRAFGKFLATVKVSRSQAHRAIQVCEMFGECPSVGQFDLAALYQLSRTSTPTAAIDAAVARADQGEQITSKVARSIIADHQPRRKQTRPQPVVITVPGGMIAVTPQDGLSVEQILIRAVKQLRDQAGRQDAA